jgi:hypothetical protein
VILLEAQGQRRMVEKACWAQQTQPPHAFVCATGKFTIGRQIILIFILPDKIGI